MFKGARLFGGPTTFTMAGSGHIAGVINAPAANKYQHWTNAKLPAALEDWQAGAVEAPGSWWPHWLEWLADKSGEQVPGPRPRQGAAEAAGRRAGRVCEGEELTMRRRRLAGAVAAALPPRRRPASRGRRAGRPHPADMNASRRTPA